MKIKNTKVYRPALIQKSKIRVLEDIKKCPAKECDGYLEPLNFYFRQSDGRVQLICRCESCCLMVDHYLTYGTTHAPIFN